MASQKDFSEETTRLIDEKIRKIVQDMENTAIKILKNHKNKLEILAQGLLENESLSKKKIDQLFF